MLDTIKYDDVGLQTAVGSRISTFTTEMLSQVSYVQIEIKLGCNLINMITNLLGRFLKLMRVSKYPCTYFLPKISMLTPNHRDLVLGPTVQARGNLALRTYSYSYFLLSSSSHWCSCILCLPTSHGVSLHQLISPSHFYLCLDVQHAP